MSTKGIVKLLTFKILFKSLKPNFFCFASLKQQPGEAKMIKRMFLYLVLLYVLVQITPIICYASINPILDGVRGTPIMYKGEKAPQFNSTIWCLTTMKLSRNRVQAKNFSKNKNLVTS